MADPGLSKPPRGLAITAMVLGFLALVGFFTIVAAVLGFFAIVTGAVALRRIRYGQSAGRAMAITGITLGVLGVLLAVLFALALGYWVAESGLNELSRCVSRAGDDPVATQDCGKSFDEHFQDRFGPPPTEPDPAQ